MLAILDNAIDCLRRSGRRTRKRERIDPCREAEKWIQAQGTDYLFSFETICGVFAWDADQLRHELLQIKWEDFRKPNRRR